MNDSHSHQQPKPLNLKSLRTRFALRFLRALRNINHQEKQNNDVIGFKVAQRYKKVKVASNASMASAVGPKRAWSRAVLLRTRPISARKVRRGKRCWAEGRAGELRRLVPGGEDMDLQSLLDETAHYIKCLTTQVMVMRSIVDYCSTT